MKASRNTGTRAARQRCYSYNVADIVAVAPDGRNIVDPNDVTLLRKARGESTRRVQRGKVKPQPSAMRMRQDYIRTNLAASNDGNPDA